MLNNFLAVIDIVKQIWAILNRKQKKSSIIVFGCLVVSSLFELLGITAIMPFIYEVIDIETLMQNKYISYISGMLGITKNSQMITLCGAGIIIIYIIKNLILLLSAYIQINFRCKVERDLSVEMLTAYMKRPYAFFLNTNSAEIMRGIGTDVSGVFFSLDFLFNILSQSLTLVLIAGFIIYTDWFMALGVITLTVVCILAITLGLKDRMRKMGLQFREADGLKTQAALQAVQGIKEISIMQRRDFFTQKYRLAYNNLVHSNIMKCFLTRLPDKIIETLFVAGIIGLVCIRTLLYGDGGTVIPMLAAFAMAAYRLLPSVGSISNSFSNLAFYRPSVQSTYQNLKSAKEYDKYLSGKQNLEESDICKFKKEISICNIKWRYENTDIDVIDNLSMKIKRGESVAFIGESGAGKSTLSDIILGLLKPQEGQVSVDGVDIFSIPMQWSRMIGYVPQSVYLIDDTIRANVAFGIDDDEIDDERVWRVLEEAQLKEYVKKLPKTINTIVGERGIKFSGGQRQRIAIARALYYNPDILILDEATSALDNETEEAVMEAIDYLHGQKTLIIIAHRLSTIKSCDRVYEIKDGTAKIKNRE